MISVQVCVTDIDIGEAIGSLSSEGVGGVATFLGIVRGDDGLVSLTLEHYPAMTERALMNLAQQAATRWHLTNVIVVHRVGTMFPGERIVFVGTASLHRAAALESCTYLIDRLKTDAPFWKREAFTDGRTAWVEPRATDEAATARWI